MFRKLTFWGWLLTGIYLAWIIGTVWYKFDKFLDLDLNNLGDFLAGVFGPVAFLWLVLGYLQQGKELKVSSDALQLQAEELRRSVEQQTLQAEELKKSVEQQTIMAEATIKLNESQQAALEFQKQELERAVSANFSIVQNAESINEQSRECSVLMTNYGALARSVQMNFDPPIGHTHEFKFHSFEHNHAKTLNLNFNSGHVAKEWGGICKIKYEDERGKEKIVHFNYIASAMSLWIVFKAVTMPAEQV